MDTRILRGGYLYQGAIFLDVEVAGQKHNVGTSDGSDTWSTMHVHGERNEKREQAARVAAQDWAGSNPKELLRLIAELQKEKIKTEQQAEDALRLGWSGYSGTAERDGDTFIVALTPYATEGGLVVQLDDLPEARSTASFGDAIDKLARLVPPQDPHFWETLAWRKYPGLR